MLLLNKRLIVVFAILNIVVILAIGATSVRAFQTRSEFEQFKFEIYKDQVSQNRELTSNTQRLSEIERRLGNFDSAHIEERLSRLESSSESNKYMLMTITAGVVLMLIEATLRMLGLKKEKSTKVAIG